MLERKLILKAVQKGSTMYQRPTIPFSISVLRIRDARNGSGYVDVTESATVYGACGR